MHAHSAAFRDASNLGNVALPSTLKSIGAYAFYGCSAMTSFDQSGWAVIRRLASSMRK